MQLKDQWKGSKNWKLITGVATAATLGFGAIAVAAPGSNDLPQTIDLNDRVAITDDSFVPNTGSFVAFDISADDTADDNVLASAQASVDVSADDTLDSSPQDASAQDDSIDADDSLDASPQASIDDSPDDSASTDSFDSADDSD